MNPPGQIRITHDADKTQLTEDDVAMKSDSEAARICPAVIQPVPQLSRSRIANPNSCCSCAL
jgi:hypothetical protein